MSRASARPGTRDVGTVLSVTPSGLLTARAASSEVVPEGTPVRDGRGIVRGKVVRVFGPVAHPYLSIRPRRAPTPAEGIALLGTPLVRDAER